VCVCTCMYAMEELSIEELDITINIVKIYCRQHARFSVFLSA